MTGPSSQRTLIVFHDRVGSGGPEPDPDEPPVDYLRTREQAERAAARSAKSAKARWVHQQLARHYARLAAERRSAAAD